MQQCGWIDNEALRQEQGHFVSRNRKRARKPASLTRTSFIESVLRSGGQSALGALKEQWSAEEIYRQFPHLIPDRKWLDQVHGPAFPRKPGDMFSFGLPSSPSGSFAAELAWAIARCRACARELAEFVELRLEYERSVIRSDWKTGEAVLAEIERQFGQSFWLFQAKLIQARTGGDPDNAYAVLGNQWLSDGFASPWVQYLVSVSVQVDRPGARTAVADSIRRVLRSLPNGNALASYAIAKLVEQGVPSLPAIASTLHYDGLLSLVDQYEGLVAALGWGIARGEMEALAGTFLRDSLRALSRDIPDARLRPILAALGVDAPLLVDTSVAATARVQAYEAYAKSDYVTASKRAEDAILDEPDDIACLVLLARAGIRAETKKLLLPSLATKIYESLGTLSSLRGEVYGAATELLAIAHRFSILRWAKQLELLVLQMLATEDAGVNRPRQRSINSLDPYLTPLFRLGFGAALDRDSPLGMRLLAEFPFTSAAIDLILTGACNGAITLSTRKHLSYMARYSLFSGDAESAISCLSQLVTLPKGEVDPRSSALLVTAFLESGQLDAATRQCVDGYLSCGELPSLFPLVRVTAMLDDTGTWSDSIDVPLMFGIYNSLVDNGRLPHLRIAFERFQEANGIADPARLSELSPACSKERIVAYLNLVWTPETMRQTLLYRSTSEIEDARVRVCSYLAKIDVANDSRYLEEIRERVKRREISKATSLVEQSKVYVDVAAIKKTLRSKLSGAYARYKASASGGDLDPAMTELLEELVKGLAGRDREVLVVAKSFFDGKASVERLKQLASLYSDISDEFLLGSHGLNAYLSTRVRHGTLSNTLRKPVADERLVTQRNEDGSYIANTFWIERLSALSETDATRIRNALEEFAISYDGVINRIKDELLQIKVVDSTKEMPAALFTYHTSSRELEAIGSRLESIEGIDDFIGHCMDRLWEKTDVNLIAVRSVLAGDVRAMFMAAFQRLDSSLAANDNRHAVSELRNALNRARTAVHRRLEEVSAWFNRSEVYDRSDYSPGLPVDIAVNILEKTLPQDGGQPSVVCTPTDGALMPGRTLDGMVDAFHALFENAIQHSGFTAGGTRIGVSIGLQNKRFTAKVTNETRPGKDIEADLRKLENIRAGLKDPRFRKRAQSEGGSGLHKIWQTINSPFYSNARLEFGFSDDQSFFVSIDCVLEEASL